MFNALRKGFGLTFKTLFRPPVTTEYPDRKRTPAPRFHGRHVLNRHPDGLEKCVGCELCAWACPADAIYVQGEDNTSDARYSPGERYAIDYQINYLRCIFCGLCIEACPTRALTMTHEYELSATSREELIFTKDDLLAPLPASAEEPPHTDEEVAARGMTYYQGGFAAQDPLAGATEDTAADAPHPEEHGTAVTTALAGGGFEPPAHGPEPDGDERTDDQAGASRWD